ncbi:uncharacterized protein JN550_010042 [Neoarthrinium moseri]|uniref:uncharacterized protein n=1 Tax=Neoarthrinium moseri TaxID=1658444 RepID=UPI001FDD74BB|nr:uncharacterized protein JN550_010042 [Neoarthrinium moseri]KAI1862705.1 hypothetical protein JN550_010042 [Neoarthrinium moseri]
MSDGIDAKGSMGVPALPATVHLLQRVALQESCSLAASRRPYIFRARHPLVLILCLIASSLWTFLHVLAPTGLVSKASDNDSPSWHQYVRAPPSRFVTPKAILPQYSKGNVTNPEGIINNRSPAHLTRQNSPDEIPTIVVDFGQNVVGLLTITFADSTSYAQGYPGLRLSFSETLEFLTNRSDFTRSDNAPTPELKIVPDGTDQIAVRPQAYTWLDQWGCEYDNQVCSDGLHGFRYVKIQLDALPSDAPYTSSVGSVAIASVGLQWSGYLGTPDTFTGWFECSDPNITQWWYDGAYTTETNIDIFRANDTEPRYATSPSLLDKVVLHDGAKRDRDPYMGDLAVAGLTSYLTHDIFEATRNVMEDLAQHQRSDGWLPPASILALFDYPLWWISCSWEYVYYSGNLSYIESYYANMKLLLESYYPSHTSTNTSLLVRPDGYGDFAFIQRPGSAAYYSALYVLALDRAADLAELLSQTTDSVSWRQRASAVSKSFVTELWDPTVDAFFDRKCAGSGCNAHAQDGNSLAVLAGIVAPNSTAAASLLAYLGAANARPYGNSFYDTGGEALAGGEGYSQRVYAFMSYFELAARFEAGQPSSALEQIRRMYGWMAAHEPGATFWEGIGAGGAPYEDGFTSMAHGWSTGIVPLMSNYVLGVKPLKPGFAEWTVQPSPGDLTWARGVVPTPNGAISVSWVIDESTGGITICVDAPPQTQGIVGVLHTAFEASEVVVNGQVIWDGKSTDSQRATLMDGMIQVRVEGASGGTGC